MRYSIFIIGIVGFLIYCGWKKIWTNRSGKSDWFL